MDVFLHRVCLAKSRSQAGNWCQEGRVRVDGLSVKASHPVRAGQRLVVRQLEREAAFEILDVPRGQVSRAQRERFLKPL